MNFTHDIFKKATIKEIAVHMLLDTAPETDERDCQTRLDDAYREFENNIHGLSLSKKEMSLLFDYVNALSGEMINVYMEIGLESGVLLSMDFLHNIGGLHTENYFHTMYDILFKSISDALKLLRDSQSVDIDIQNAIATLEAGQKLAKMIYSVLRLTDTDI